MSDYIKYKTYRCKYYGIKAKRKFNRLFKIKNKVDYRRYAGKNVLSQIEFNNEIRDCLLSGEPFMVSRFGSNEILNIIEYLGTKYGKKHLNKRYVSQLNINAGVFPPGEDMAKKFSEYMLELIPEIDYLGCWFRNMEDYILREYAINAKPVRLKYLEPYCAPNPWSAALKGKKVLVIHPFDNSIRKQYKNRELIFQDQNILPEFDLKTFRAVQSIGNNYNGFKNWFEALDFMFEESLAIDFDVAILGCGAYGLPLAARLKKAGKQAIHLGGSVQILFGIKGSRWDDDESTNKFYNDYWIRPLIEDTPEKANLVEDACYW